MNILFVTPYFPPDIGSAQRQMHQLSTRLAAGGHKVTVLTAVPHYPAGVIPPEYRKRWRVSECIDGVRVLRTWIYASSNQNSSARLLNHLSFMAAAIGNLPALPPNIDVVFTDSPPLFDGLVAFAIGRLRKIPYVFNVADLWPQILFESGICTSFPLRQIAEGLERFIYRKAAQVTTVTQGFTEVVRAKGVPSGRAHYVPLGTDIDRFTSEASGLKWRERLQVGKRCLVMYAGALGRSQGLRIILEAAELLRNEPHIMFCFMGEGLEKASLMQFARNRGLFNVKFVDAQPLDEMPAVIPAADIHVVTLKDLPLFRMTIPGKIYEILACGRPIVGALDGEAASLIKRASAGITVPLGDARALADAILVMSRDARMRSRFGKSGREYVAANHSYRRITEMLEKVLLQAKFG